MGRYLIRRSLFMVLVLFVVSVLTFIIFVKLPPGDPARRAVGRTTTPEAIEAAREAFGLDKPLIVQYGRFAKGLIPIPGLWLSGDVYYSYDNFIPVWEEIRRRLPVTVALAIGAAAVWLVIGIPIGIVSAIRRRSKLDRAAMLFALFGVSAPVFWLAYLFLFLFWFKFNAWFGWGAPSSGLDIGDSIWVSVLKGKFILPWIVLSLTFAAFYARMIRGNLIETMFGLDLGILLGGAFITESVFALPGIGQYALQAITKNDFPVVMGVTLLGTFFIAASNLIVDVAYAFLDPRVRYE
jgi:peptide/nickel transport system permease protein